MNFRESTVFQFSRSFLYNLMKSKVFDPRPTYKCTLRKFEGLQFQFTYYHYRLLVTLTQVNIAHHHYVTRLIRKGVHMKPYQ